MKSTFQNKINQFRDYLANKLATDQSLINNQQKAPINLVDHLQNNLPITHPSIPQNSNRIIIKKSELIWIMDTIYSNTELIKKLKDKTNYVTEVNVLNRDNRKLSEDNSELLDLVKNLRERNQNLLDIVKEQKIINEDLEITNEAYKKLIEERNESFEKLVVDYSRELYENEIRHNENIKRGFDSAIFSKEIQ